MTYVSWAAVYEGPTDKAYFDILIPRLMEEITLRHGTRNSTIPPNPAVALTRGPKEKVAKEICAAQDAFHVLFIHADTGGRNLAAGLADRSCAYCDAAHNECEWPRSRCIVITPNRETEAWILADPMAVTSALGFNGPSNSIGLPANARIAERLPDPKSTLRNAVKQVRGDRRPLHFEQFLPAVAQRQSFDFLRQSNSFAQFELALRSALADLGCVTNT